MSGIAAQKVTARLGARTVLEGIDLHVAPGELVALVGPNGAGKTTLLRVLAGELVPRSGRVVIDGKPLSARRAIDLARIRAVLPQATSVEFAFSAREVVEMGRAPYVGTGAMSEDGDVIAWAMSATDCAHLAAREFRTLSGGEQGRVNLARVLAQRTVYLLLDEPTAALDLRHQELVMSLAADRASEGCGVVAVVHDLNLAAAYANRVGMLCDGHLVALGTPRDVLTAERLTQIYAYEVAVLEHPSRGCPLIVPTTPIRGATSRLSIPRMEKTVDVTR